MGKRVLLGRGVRFRCKGKNLCIGDGVVIKDNVKFESIKSVVIKDYVKIHADVSIQRGIDGVADLRIGFNSWVGEKAILNCARDIIIGNNACVGINSMIWTHGHFLSKADGYSHKFGDVKVEDGVWIASSCQILPNVKLGEYSIVGPSSVITKNIPSRVTATGIPCRLIKSDEKQYRKTLTPEEKIDLVLSDCINYIKLQGFRVKSEGNNSWYVSFYHKRFLIAFRKEFSDLDMHTPTCIFTWESIEEAFNSSKKVSVFILSNNTYTKKRTFHEWVVIRALLDTCTLRLLPVEEPSV